MRAYKWRYGPLLLAVLLLVSLCGCGRKDSFDKDADESDREAPSQVEQDDGYPVTAGGVTMTFKPTQVVSLAPSLTEKMYDLGLDDRLTGVSDYCDYPSSVTQLPRCGTAQLPDVGMILDLEPHLVIAETQLDSDALAQLEEANIPVAVLGRAGSVEELSYNYIDLAKLMQGEHKGQALGAEIADEFRMSLNDLRSTTAAYTNESGRKKVLYLRMLDFVVATGDTFEQELLEVACIDNVAADYSGWQIPEDEAVSGQGAELIRSVDIILMDGEQVAIADLEAHDYYKSLPAVRQDRIYYISSLALERQSLRTVRELEELAAYVYPEAFGGTNSWEDSEDDVPEGAEADMAAELEDVS